MWLTGFDSPSLHTMYVDKPMRGAGRMQAIARVNRTFRDKPGGLVVDYIGIAESLRAALADYTDRDRARQEVGAPVEEALALLQENHESAANFSTAARGERPWSQGPTGPSLRQSRRHSTTYSAAWTWACRTDSFNTSEPPHRASPLLSPPPRP